MHAPDPRRASADTPWPPLPVAWPADVAAVADPESHSPDATRPSRPAGPTAAALGHGATSSCARIAGRPTTGCTRADAGLGSMSFPAWPPGRAQSSLTLDDNTRDAHRRSSDGLPLLAYDDQLSALLGQTDNPASATRPRQRFLAESVALLTSRPGTSSRSVLVAASRSFNPIRLPPRPSSRPPSSIPWLEPVTTRPCSPRGPCRRRRPGGRPNRPRTHRVPPPRPTAAAMPAGAQRPPAGHPQSASATSRGRPASAAPPRRLRQHLGRDRRTSWSPTRWRGLPARVDRLAQQIAAATRETNRRGSASSTRDVNFLADDRPPAVHRHQRPGRDRRDVKLPLTSDPPPAHRQPARPLRIGASSRTTATGSRDGPRGRAGADPPTLTTAGRHRHRRGTPMSRSRSRPTGDWVYWALGGCRPHPRARHLALRRRRRPTQARRRRAGAPPPNA